MAKSRLGEIWEIYWRYILLIVTPLAFSPLLIISQSKEATCAYVIGVMCVYWVGDVLPIAAVSFIPVFAFPMFGILDTETVCQTYMNEANLLFLSSLIAGVALEQSCIHRRIALVILMKVGASPRLLLMGVMLTTMCMSTWIMDTAACAMMIPIVDAIMRHLESVDTSMLDNEDSENDDTQTVSSSLPSYSPRASFDLSPLSIDIALANQAKRDSIGMTNMNMSPRPSTASIQIKYKASKFEKALILSVSYASAIGGIGTLTGTTTNLVFKELAVKMYGDSTGISYATWMMIGMPTIFVAIFALCFILQICSIGLRVKPQTEERKRCIKEMLEKQYQDLGSLRVHEYSVITCIALLVALWFFRDTEFMKGWGALFVSQKMISDAVPAYFIIIVMCALPVCYPPTSENSDHLVEWEVVEKKIPWDILILQGGGFAMAAAADTSGLTAWLGRQLSVLTVLPIPLVCWSLAVITAYSSELLANSSLAAMFLPVVADMADHLHVHPFYFMIPITIGATLAFTLPISSGPNAIAYKTGKITMKDMVIPGLLANVTAVSVMFLLHITLGSAIFHYGEFPEWAMNRTSVSQTML